MAAIALWLSALVGSFLWSLDSIIVIALGAVGALAFMGSMSTSAALGASRRELRGEAMLVVLMVAFLAVRFID